MWVTGEHMQGTWNNDEFTKFYYAKYKKNIEFLLYFFLTRHCGWTNII